MGHANPQMEVEKHLKSHLQFKFKSGLFFRFTDKGSNAPGSNDKGSNDTGSNNTGSNDTGSNDKGSKV